MAKKIIWITALVIIILLTFLTIYFFQLSSPRLSYIARISQLEIPSTASIVEYQFGITSFGIEPFFAKLELNQEEYKVLREYFLYDGYVELALSEFHRMQQNFNYMSVSVENIVEIGWRDRLTSRTSIFLAGSSRLIHAILVATDDNEYFIYIFYHTGH